MGLLYKSSKLLKIILDSLEDQEGGAMYISCDVSNGGPVEPETGYVPNNPLFGLALDSPQQECAAASCIGCLSCQGHTVLPLSSLPSNDFDCGSCFDPIVVGDLGGSAQNNSQVLHNTNNICNNNNGSNTGNNIVSGNTCASNYWSTDEMASTFPGLPPLDIDPLPSLFPFSPCGASYNFSANPHQASLSYTVHPHQMLVSPNSHQHQQHQNQHHHHNQHHQQHQSGAVVTTSTSSSPPASALVNSISSSLIGGQQSLSQSNALNNVATQSCYYDPLNTTPTSSASSSVSALTGNLGGTSCASQHMGGQQGTGSAGAAAAMYPSMSVNVSMNMTMHGYGAADATMPMQCSQMQWTPTNSSSAVNVLYPPLLSPSHYPAAATYSFTADFRAPSLQTNQNPSSLLPSLNEALEKDSSPPPAPLLDAVTPKSFYTSTQVGQSYSPPTKSPTLFTQMRDTKPFSQISGPPSNSGVASGYEDEDSNEEGSDNKPNLCRLCGKTYARPSTLKTHLRTHSGERPYRCPDCNKSFSQAANLTAHVRTHTGQKPFRCPICDRRFSQSSSVTTHMRTHSGERPYRCSACKKSFSDSSTLTKHLRIHSGEKPYQCKLCLLRFSQSGNLNRHMRVHSANNNGSNLLT